MGTVRKSLLHRTMIAKVVLTLTIAGLASAAPQLFDTVPLPARTRIDSNEVVSSVISTLQPAIAAAVAEALRGSSFGSSRPTGSSGSGSTGSGSTGFAGSKATPAKYNYEYKVANDNTQTYITQKEDRDGLEVTGTYSYVDPTGAIITVNYQAGELGYSEQRERQDGAVTIRPQPVSATGPATGTGSNANLDVDRLIAQVLAALQPAIEQSVSNAVNRRG